MENVTLRQALDTYDKSKEDKVEVIPGRIGVRMAGGYQIYCTNRPGYIWVRLHGNNSEFIQAFNNVVIPEYDHPVYVARNPYDKSKYYVLCDNQTPQGTNGDIEYYLYEGQKRLINIGTAGQVLAVSQYSATPFWDTRYKPTFFTNEVTHADWDGDAKGTGDTTFTCNNFNASISSLAVALLMSLASKWSAASDANYVLIKPTGGTGNGLVARSLVANIGNDLLGVVPLSTNHQFTISVGGAATDYTKVSCWGYWSAS